MADLSELNSAGMTKVIGSDATGQETTPVASTTNGELKTINPSDGTTGAAVPAQASLIGGKNSSGNLVPALIDRNGYLKSHINSDVSTFGPLVVLPRVQQVSVDFSQTLTNNDLTQTISGSGTVSVSGGNGTISTGTSTTAAAKLQTNATTSYIPGREIYAQFTAAFTTPTSAASFQRAGLYDTNNGLFIGFSGLSFGITSRATAVDTFVASASFSQDTLTGGVNSLFTRNGTPEAVNFSYKNVYRIRAGWLGAAPIYFEILSPDGVWVTFHIIRQPNTSVNPAFSQPSLPITIEVSKTASNATNLQLVTTSFDAGTVDIPDTDTSNSGTITALNGTMVVNCTGRRTAVMDITGTWIGTLSVQGNVGNGNWVSLNAINTNAVSGSSISSNQTITVGCAGFAEIRLIATAWTSGTANIHWVASASVSSIFAQIVGNVPSGSADSGNPIKVGGVYNSSLPTVSTGQRVDLQLDSNGRLLTSSTVTSSLPAASFSVQASINTGVTKYTSFTAAQKLALKQFYAGGTGIGKQALYSYSPSTAAFVNGGDFEAAGDVGTTWVWTSAGGTGSAAQSAVQAQTGTKSAAITFTNSSGTNAQGLKQTFSTAQDFTLYRYVQAYFFNVVSAGGAYTRTISIILTDTAGNTATYSTSGSSTSGPFSTSAWIQLQGEILNPISTTGTVFDYTSIASMELRMADSGNKAGTVYWDTVKLISALTPIFPIYHYQNTSLNIVIDPVFIMNIGDQIIIAQTNNDTVRKEYFALAGGVTTT